MVRAPKACAVPGCPHPVAALGRCDRHQPERAVAAWTVANPRDDRAIRLKAAPRILARDRRRCYRCGGHATQVDHIIPVAEGGSHADTNLASVCQPCQARKASEEGLRARQRQAAARAARGSPHTQGAA